jgi:hypothetical protein
MMALDKQEAEENNLTERVRKNPWMISTIVLGIIALLLVTFVMPKSLTGNAISEKDASDKIMTYVNSVASAPVTFVASKDLGNFYEVQVLYQNQTLPLYISKDGQYWTSVLQAMTPAQTQPAAQTKEVPKTAKPVVELFVMSFCPYGVKAESNILPVIELLKNKIDFKIRFIVSVAGDTINDVNSLHGINEAKEDARQLIIMKYYPDKYYSYLKEFDANCYPVASDSAKLETCWKATAGKYGIDANKIETAAYGQEGIALLKTEEAETVKYKASGSPTLVINGVQSSAIYSGTSATQAAICNAFSTAPSECGTAVQSNSTTTTSASCG